MKSRVRAQIHNMQSLKGSMKEDLWCAQKERPSVPGRSEKRRRGQQEWGRGWDSGKGECSVNLGLYS